MVHESTKDSPFGSVAGWVEVPKFNQILSHVFLRYVVVFYFLFSQVITQLDIGFTYPPKIKM